jgi:hypothetical protein
MITTVNDPVAVDLPLNYTGQELVLWFCQRSCQEV